MRLDLNVDEKFYSVLGGPDRRHGARGEGRQEMCGARDIHLIDVMVDDTGFLEDFLNPTQYHLEDKQSAAELGRYFLSQWGKDDKWFKIGAGANLSAFSVI